VSFPSPARVIALASAITLLGATGAHAATFLPPKSIGAPSGFGDDSYDIADTASDGEGNSIVVYDRVNCATSTCVVTAHYLRGAAGKGYSAPVELGSMIERDVAMNGEGHAVIVYGDGTTLRALLSTPGGNFGAPTTLSSAGGSNPHVAIADNGAAVATWERGGVIRAAVKPAGAGAFGAEVPVSAAGESAGQSQLAVDRAGNAAVAWINGDRSVRASTKSPTGGFGPRQTLFTASAGTLDNVRVGASSDRRATVVWAGTTGVVQAAASDASGTFGDAETVAPAGALSYTAELAVDGANRAVAIWVDQNEVMNAAVRGAGGDFGAPEPIADEVQLTYAENLSVDRHGNVLALWSDNVPGGATVIGARRPVGGSFDDPETLSAAGELALGAAAGFDAGGNGHIVYTARQSGVWSVREVGLDVSGPQLRSLSLPAGGEPGQALAFSVRPFDRWSGATTAWDFGDGGRASGNAASHAYAAPGAYAVTVSAEDALGQRTSATRVVTVRARDVAGGGGGSTGGGATTVTGGGLSVIGSTVTHGWMAYRRYTVARRLAATNLPAGATVTVTCRSKPKKRCPKARRVTTTFPRARLDLVKPFRKRKLPVGTRITVSIAVPGAIGKVVTLTIRKRALPSARTQCRPPGGRPAACV
jgi:hypothetical protein